MNLLYGIFIILIIFGCVEIIKGYFRNKKKEDLNG